MYFLHIVCVVVYILFPQIQHVKAQAGAEEPPDPDPDPGDPETKDPESDSNEYYEDRLARVDSHTFVVLLDIVFTDGSKKTCTGAIIAEHAVITAAHCFITRKEEVQPELSFSFVILGTKKMFESGYESYLPIERIETHPNFKGWTADLAIVFTFPDMVAEKHGTIVPLAGERSSTPVDSNVTIFSWGHCSAVISKSVPVKYVEETAYPPAGDNEEGTTEDTIMQGPTKIRANMKSKLLSYPQKKQPRSVRSGQVQYHVQEVEPYTAVVRAQKKLHLKSKWTANNSRSRYLSDDNAEHYGLNRRINGKNRRRPSEPQEIDENSSNSNGRRVSERKTNNLTIEEFGFVNAQTCKKLVDRSMPPLYSIQNKNEVLCYSSDYHYITADDSGAPAVQHGKLVAVTVGGVDSEGEHVAVGMKMSCFCSWIVETLPMYEEAVNIKCCKNCCDVKKQEANNNNQGEADQVPDRPGRRGKPNQRYRLADADDHDENEYADQSQKKRYEQ